MYDKAITSKYNLDRQKAKLFSMIKTTNSKLT